MTYTEAVELAKRGNEAGFAFLYEATYQSKYYLALKYMQNEEAARDVVQDAYIRAFERLDMLENPESFASWLGMIVANTAKNALQRRNPVLFSDIAGEADGTFEYQIEDENIQNQPEEAYSQRETQELVHELMDSLPAEQRMCILMFHIEGQSIREIADVLGCSENTVKSRLNYGRKNIKARAEALQKRGYKLYAVAPVALLLSLLRSEQSVLAASGAFVPAGRAMANQISGTLVQKSLVRAAGTKGAAAGSRRMAGAAKRGFIQTTAGKITAAVVGICITAGAVTAAVASQSDGSFLANIFGGEESSYVSAEADTAAASDEAETESMTDAAAASDEAEIAGAIEGAEAASDEAEIAEIEEVEAEETELELTDEECVQLLSGGITREDFEFLLAYGPQTITDGEVDTEDLETLLLRITMTGGYHNLSIKPSGEDNAFDLSEMNNYISVLTSYQLNEADNSLYEHTNVSGDTVYVVMAEPATSNYVTIQNAVLSGDTITVTYDFDSVRYSDDTGEEAHNTAQKTATLRRLDDGAYRITDIVSKAVLTGRRDAYILTLDNLYTTCLWPDGSTVDVMGDMAENLFAVYDVDGDGEEELIIKYTSSSSAGMQEAVFGYDEETDTLVQELSEYPALTYYDNGFIRADASHNQGSDPDAWPYTMYQYSEDSGTYEEIGSGVANDGSIEGYVGSGNEIELPYLNLTAENIQSIQ